MKIAIIGVGAVGGVIAARLLAAGADVTLVVAREEQAARLQSDGLTLRQGATGQTVAVPRVVPAAHMVRALPRDFDLILIATKSAAMPLAAEAAARHLASGGVLLLLQNGLPEETAVLILPRRRVLGAVIGWNAARHDDHTVVLLQPGETVVGAAPRGSAVSVPTVVEALAPLGSVRATANLPGVRWHKLAINAVINPLTAIGGVPLGAALADRHARRLAVAALREAIAIWQALGVSEEPLANTPRLARLAALPVPLQHLALLVLGWRNRDVRPSMLRDVEHGQATEVRALNGEIVRLGEQEGVATPVNGALLARIEALEAGARRPTPSAYRELARVIS